MSKWFRSEPMEYISLIMNEDAAHDCLADLGKMGVIQFTDLNPELTPFQRRYVSYVKRCDELERKLRYFNAEIAKFNNLECTPAGKIDNFLEEHVGTTRSDQVSALDVLEKGMEQSEKSLKELNTYNEKLTHEFNEMVEYQEVLEKAGQFFAFDKSSFADKVRLDMMKFQIIAGVVPTEERMRFDRMIFRATRGNTHVIYEEIDQEIVDPESGNLTSKSVFLIFFKSTVIESKLKKICDAFLAHRYTLPDMSGNDAAAVTQLMADNRQELIDSRSVLLANRDARYRVCKSLAANVEKWTWILLKEKAIYHTMNQLKADVSGMLRGEGWVVSENLNEAIDAIDQAHAHMDMAMPSMVRNMPQPWPTPPTHFVTNKFTYPAQLLTDTYGTPRYREANPSLFNVATFPFLFGVMYGDIGHGLFLFLCGSYLCLNEKAIENAPGKMDEIFGGIFMGRYMILMMGFFAVYAGLVYNDCMSLGINLFGTRYTFEGQETMSAELGTVATQTAPYGSDESVYPFGLDPIWHVSSNEIIYFNGFKMKTAVIFGVFQMYFGLLIRGLNAIYFKSKIDFFFEFLPMLTYATSFFMYMDFMIFYKWSVDWNERMSSATCYDPSGDEWQSDWTMCDTTASDADGTCTPWGYSCTGKDSTADKCPLDYGGSGDGCQPPNIMTTLMAIVLSPGNVEEPLYDGQGQVQLILVAIFFLSIPVLLVGKPFMMKYVHDKKPVVVHAGDDDDDDDDEFSFGDIFIHQAIETIETALGWISCTASYLRLWALSLAHSELASVFWSKAMLAGLNSGAIGTYLAFGVFAGVTLGVLLCMDVLECFLHALRLHWVEFQNRFYYADGIPFAPYSFKKIITEAAA